MFQTEMAFDIRKPAVLAAAGLQVFALGLLCYLSDPLMPDKTWNGFFWLTVVFSTLQAVSKGFISISRARWIYLNQLASPGAIILAKIGYSWVLMLLLVALDLGVFAFFLDLRVVHLTPYLFFTILVAGGLGTVFTMISAIASKATQPGFLVPVLSLPVILPLLLIGVQGSIKCMKPILADSTWNDVALLASLDILLFVLAATLFNPLWRD